jgi:hypothetical protein
MVLRNNPDGSGIPLLKITDFGLSRTLSEETGYYVMGTGAKMPARYRGTGSCD